ncbi:MAG: Phosphate regulon transcriptional regulatory protein PhoB (SphR), partial [uncultured Thermoleophilia bacterium]
RRDAGRGRSRGGGRAPRGPRAAHRSRQAGRRGPGHPRDPDLRGVRDPSRARRRAGPRVHPGHAPHADLGGLGLPRSPDDRRPHPPPAREDRARRQGPGVPLHRARRGLPLPRHGRL